MSKSKQKTGFFGDKYTEHTNDQGEKIGESRQRTGFFGGEYTEHTDKDGNKTGESRDRTGFFGSEYVEHTNKMGDKTGESNQRTGFFGDKYVEHTDKDGNKIGESRKKKGFFRDEYVENTGAGRRESISAANEKMRSATQSYNKIKETSLEGWLISYALAGFALSILIFIFSDMGFGKSFGIGFILPLFWKIIVKPEIKKHQ